MSLEKESEIDNLALEQSVDQRLALVEILTLLIFVGCVIAGIVIFLDEYSGPYTITGRISNITYYEKGLNIFTQVTFDGEKSISFQGHLMFDVGKKYTFQYHKFGLLWELLGYEATNSLDYARVIE